MKAKTKKEDKTLFVELKLKRMFNKVLKKKEVTVIVKTSKRFQNNELKFMVREEPFTNSDNIGYVLFELNNGLQTRVIQKRKVVTSMKRIIKNLCNSQGYRVSFI